MLQQLLSFESELVPVAVAVPVPVAQKSLELCLICDC